MFLKLYRPHQKAQPGHLRLERGQVTAKLLSKTFKCKKQKDTVTHIKWRSKACLPPQQLSQTESQQASVDTHTHTVCTVHWVGQCPVGMSL